MAMDPMDREPNVYNRETNVYDNSARGSNTLAYVIGGLVIALGLLAFLFYDGGGEPSTTGSTGTQTESTAPRASSGAAGGSTTAPATPTTPAPAAPATPAPQQ
ncbi:hypothetical protein VB618_03010 [Microvirga sp. CF3062]|uniref:hypothetical protein n=1 Tax=Microvirga sp. CF3062 TaxID=3110182 RepID=UPI002E75C4EE|nr:hypothetical protein [Microvirga sp. CF3062]MEE1655153.1 hypothetical protein [Microvirga sp. CF3062]